MPKDKPAPKDNGDRFPDEEAMERMNRALRGAKTAGPKPLKEKPRASRKPRKIQVE